jgi:putative membrane protein
VGVVSTSTAAARKPGKTLVGTWAGAAFSAAGRRWRVRPAPARGTLEGMEFVTRLVATAIATAVAVWLVPGINLTASDTQGKILTLLGVALAFGVVNGVVAPIVKVLGACLIVLTLGFFLLVINALMLQLTSWLAGVFGLGFHVDGFWPAFWGALIISVVGALLGGLLGSGRTQLQES